MPLHTHDTLPDAGDFQPLGAPVRNVPPAPAAKPRPVPGKPGFVTLPDGRLGTALPLPLLMADTHRPAAGCRVELGGVGAMSHCVRWATQATGGVPHD